MSVTNEEVTEPRTVTGREGDTITDASITDVRKLDKNQSSY